jgi:hypothetical protein
VLDVENLSDADGRIGLEERLDDPKPETQEPGPDRDNSEPSAGDLAGAAG